MYTARRPAAGTDENVYGAAAGGKPGSSSSSSSSLNKPSSSSTTTDPSIGPSGLTGGKTVARKALGVLSKDGNAKNGGGGAGLDEDQTLIKQGLQAQTKGYVCLSFLLLPPDPPTQPHTHTLHCSPRPRRALGEITNRLGASSSSSSSSAKQPLQHKPTTNAKQAPRIALSDLPSFSDKEEEEEVEEIECAAGRTGAEEEVLVQKKRALKEKEEAEAMLGGWKKQEEEEEEEEEMDFDKVVGYLFDHEDMPGT